jgi:hypothetical protein
MGRVLPSRVRVLVSEGIARNAMQCECEERMDGCEFRARPRMSNSCEDTTDTTVSPSQTLRTRPRQAHNRSNPFTRFKRSGAAGPGIPILWDEETTITSQPGLRLP